MAPPGGSTATLAAPSVGRRTTARTKARGRADAAGFAAAVIVGAILSLVATGYVFGIDNNSYHLPIVAALYDEPQFRSDAFIQSLRHYAAGPWLLLAGSDRILDPHVTFAVLAFVSRVLSLTGFLACASLLGVTGLAERLIFSVLVAFSTPMLGLSLAGGGGLFINSFSHSEMANGLTLIMLAFVARGRLAAGLATDGLVFFTNAFVAIWNFGPLAAMIARLLAARRVTVGRAAIGLFIGAVAFAVFATPVIVNVLRNPDYGHRLPVDYVTYLRSYWPLHFLFDSNSLGAKIGLATVTVAAALSFRALGRRAELFQAALAGYVVVYAVGIAAPAVTHSPAILNLHLLRSSTCLHLLASLGLAALATTWLTGANRLERHLLGPVLALATCSTRALLPLAALVIVLSLVPVWRERLAQAGRGAWTGGRVRLAALALLLVAASVQTARQEIRNTRFRREARHWTEIGQWARSHTGPDAEFLIPTMDIKPGATPPRSFAGDSSTFQFASHRRIWTAYGEGAAVMWSPSFYTEWNSRIWTVLALPDLPARLRYARANGIDYVVDLCRTSGNAPLFQTDGVCVYGAGARTEAGRRG